MISDVNVGESTTKLRMFHSKELKWDVYVGECPHLWPAHEMELTLATIANPKQWNIIKLNTLIPLSIYNYDD